MRLQTSVLACVLVFATTTLYGQQVCTRDGCFLANTLEQKPVRSVVVNTAKLSANVVTYATTQRVAQRVRTRRILFPRIRAFIKRQ